MHLYKRHSWLFIFFFFFLLNGCQMKWNGIVKENNVFCWVWVSRYRFYFEQAMAIKYTRILLQLQTTIICKTSKISQYIYSIDITFNAQLLLYIISVLGVTDMELELFSILSLNSTTTTYIHLSIFYI